MFSDTNVLDTNDVDTVLSIVNDASDAVMAIYNDPNLVEVNLKLDKSPLTNADMASHHVITDGLRLAFPSIPIVSEESPIAENRQSRLSEYYWLIDPIDGTKEFIKRNGQFTVCVALMKNNWPQFGVVAAPAFGLTYYGGPQMGSFVVGASKPEKRIMVAGRKIGLVYGSISHPSDATKQYNFEHYNNYTVQECGSQLKFVYVAEGKADAYPRLDHTMRTWDIAAGHAILLGAGGSMTRPDGSAISYLDKDFFAGNFVASSGYGGQ